MTSNPIAYRGEILHFTENRSTAMRSQAIAGPQQTKWQELAEYFNDGMLVIEDGHISALADAEKLIDNLPTDCEVIDCTGHLLIPGFVDTHVHYPQCEIIASHGTQLLDWLETYTFPTELQFQNEAHARQMADFFLDELLRNGTTTALVFGTVHTESVDAFFEQARRRKLRMICGKVMMDRHAPTQLLDTAESSYIDSKRLIQRWHGQDRLGYAVTPRFAPTSSPDQLHRAGQLLTEHPDVHLHTHLSENLDECRWVSDLFPAQKDYLDVYDNYGLIGPKSVFAHGIHLSDREWTRLAQARANLAHCPCSNLFIGSGLFRLAEAVKHNIDVGLGTDVGGGDSFSMFRVMNEAYKIQQLQGEVLDPFNAFYLATLGGAKTLDLDRCIGNFEVGKEADFLTIDEGATPLMAMRRTHSKTIQERLFALAMLGDDRAIKNAHIMGQVVGGKFVGEKFVQEES